MDRAEQTKQTLTQLYGRSDSPLAGTDPEFAAIKTRLIYGEVYAEEKLSAKLRELVILVVATTNQTMDEVKRHTAAALAAEHPGHELLLVYGDTGSDAVSADWAAAGITAQKEG